MYNFHFSKGKYGIQHRRFLGLKSISFPPSATFGCHRIHSRRQASPFSTNAATGSFCAFQKNQKEPNHLSVKLLFLRR